MNLYIDIGNSYIKFSVLDNDIKTFKYKTKDDYSSDSLFSILSDDLKNSMFENVYIVSVVPKMESLIIELSNKFFNKEPRMVSHPMKMGINVKTKNPKEVGSDLVCLAAYASSICDNAIIVNMGTATTLTHVKNNELIGVNILPGIELQINSLINNAAKISDMNLKVKNSWIGKDTEESISIGILNAQLEIIKIMTKSIDSNANVIVSGGNSKYFINDLPNEFTLVEEATTLGMMEIIKKYDY